MKTTITFDVNSTNCNGSMHLLICSDDQEIYSNNNFPEGPSTVTFDVNWPTTLKITVSNKNKNDMEIDATGTITKDKAIEITGIKINNFPLHIDLIDQVFSCRRDNHSEITHENYWGFNGTIEMCLTENNPMRYMLKNQSQFDLNRLGTNSHE
jgi:hypothetical protein